MSDRCWIGKVLELQGGSEREREWREGVWRGTHSHGESKPIVRMTKLQLCTHAMA